MAGDDARGDAHLVDQGAEAKAQRLNAEKVQFRRLGIFRSAKPPARVIFAETRGLHQRRGLEVIGIGGDIGARRLHVESQSLCQSSAEGWVASGGATHNAAAAHGTVLVAIMLRFVRALRRDADIGGLLAGQFGQRRAQLAEVEAGDLLIQRLGQGIDLVPVGLAVGP